MTSFKLRVLCSPFLLYASLYQKIDVEKLQCLNESEEGSGKTVFKPWEDRLDRTKVSIRERLRIAIGLLVIWCPR